MCHRAKHQVKPIENLIFSKVSELRQRGKFPPDVPPSKISSKTYGKLDNFNCVEFTFDCSLEFTDCASPDCPLGQLYFGNLDQTQNTLEVYMDCQYPINSYTFSISGLSRAPTFGKEATS